MPVNVAWKVAAIDPASPRVKVSATVGVLALTVVVVEWVLESR